MVDYQESDKGKCMSCGFLAKHIENISVPNPHFYEVDEYGRESGNVFTVTPDSNRGAITTGVKIKCFRQLLDVENEYKQIAKEKEDRQAILSVLNKDRQCQKWYPYSPGFSPKEHLEEMKGYELEHRREEFEHRIERERQEFDLQLFEISQKLQQDSKSIVEKSDRFNRRITFWIILLAILEVVGTFVTLLFPNGILKKPAIDLISSMYDWFKYIIH